MCRMLGYVSRTAVTLDDMLGEGRGDFLALARKHGDGWGHAWVDGDAVEVRKAAESALESAELERVARDQRAEAAVTHLRWATLGLDVRQGNTHPFTDGKVAFAHNGSIAPPAGLDALVPADLAAQRQGDTDSERYFLALLARLRTSVPEVALRETVTAIAATEVAAKSLNAMLLTRDSLVAVCCYDPASEEDPDYYPLLYRSTADAVVVTSTGWTDSEGWQTLSNGQLLVVQRDTLRTSVLTIDAPMAAVTGADV